MMKVRITNKLFLDFVECKYKAYIKLTGKCGQKSEFEEFRNQQLQQYHAQARQHLLHAYRGKQVCTSSCLSLSDVLTNGDNLVTDVVATESDVTAHFDALIAALNPTGATLPHYIPVMFIPEEKISKIHRLSLAFCGLILAFRLGTEPLFGRIIHGDNFRNSKVHFDRLLIKAERILREIRTLTMEGESPPLHLNVHCFVCEYRKKCHTIAVEKDHLSLLRGMKGKELSKLNNKGIFTVTQLSYTFRPRKKSKRTNPKSVRHHHSLKALAIREKRIYVIGRPELNMTGTPVYLDVEGIPDQDFYYLIGLKVGSADSCFQRFFWADSSVDEEKIWRECMQTLVTIDNPQLLHYGSYETTFLSRMRIRYPPKADEVAIVDRLIEGAQNVLSVIYGHIYFPTYSNSIKDIASFLGYAWSMDDPSGHKSLLLRHRWELCHGTSIRQDLITYNAEDCEALEVVVKTVEGRYICYAGAPRRSSYRHP